jgi:hypothetical protein
VPHTCNDILAAGAAHLTYRQLDHWTRTGHLRIVGETLCGSGRQQQWADGEDQVATRMARLVAGGVRDLATAERIARGDPELAPGITILFTDTTHDLIAALLMDDDLTEPAVTA